MSIFSHARNGAKDAPLNRSQSNSGEVTVGDDFPMLCETCMGQNPYVRMVKLQYGQKLCKISNLPYQGFRWKAGPQGRYKETIISIEVARERNICQACLNDMKYGVPSGVRDSILKNENQIARPTSEVGQMYHYQQLARNQDEYGSGSLALEDIPRAAATQLDRFSRALQVAEAKNKTAFRNLPKLCSFWLNGSCTRVLRKTCPFRPCCGTFVFPEIAGSARELCAQLIGRLEKEGPAAVQKNIDSATKDAFRESMKGNREEAIRQRVSGEDDLSKKYLGKMKASHMELTPPEDTSITTLWLGNIDADISEQDIRDVIYSYGHILTINLVRAGKCAFVEYASRDMAEYAATQMFKALMIKGKVVSVNWARPRAQALVSGGGSGGGGPALGTGPAAMLPPPGMDKADVGAYALPDAPLPFLQPPPPPGPPPSGPGSGASLTVGSVRSLHEATSGDSRDDGNNADEEVDGGDKKRRAIAPGLGSGPGSGPGLPQRPIAAALLYPSMNPARMGSKA